MSRLIHHIAKHDCGTMSAFRSEYTMSENKKRNQILKAQLLSKGYGVTPIEGVFIENYGNEDAVKVKESAFFIIDLHDKGNLKKDMKGLGKEWDQDSILFIPRNPNITKGIDLGSYLIGLKSGENAYPLLDEEYPMPVTKFGKEGNQFLSQVNGRPFYFSENSLKESAYASNIFSRQGWSLLAKKDWKTISDDVI